MGLFLAQAMSWFARPEDDLSHVLVASHFEQDPHFYFPDRYNRAHDHIIDFALQSFVRLRGLLPPLFAKECHYAQMVKLSQIYLEDISHQAGQLTLDMVKRTLDLESCQLLHLQPLTVGLYLFLFEYASTHEGQLPFHFKNAFAYRESLAECLERAAIGLNQPKHLKGLSALARADHEEDWPPWWQLLGGQEENGNRLADLNNAFTRVNKDFKSLWDKASFRVQMDSTKGNPSRWVDIPLTRMVIIE